MRALSKHAPSERAAHVRTLRTPRRASMRCASMLRRVKRALEPTVDEAPLRICLQQPAAARPAPVVVATPSDAGADACAAPVAADGAAGAPRGVGRMSARLMRASRGDRGAALIGTTAAEAGAARDSRRPPPGTTIGAAIGRATVARRFVRREVGAWECRR
eukprot:363563-Chlamydomonas_euryale.AAC.8